MDVYKVGVVLSLKNGISAGLRIIQGDLGNFMRSVDRVNNSVGKLSTNLFKAAGASAAMGVGILALYEDIIKKGDLMQQQIAKMQAAGIPAQQIALNEKAAWAAANGGVYDVSPQQAMGTISVLRSLLGSSAEARKALDPVLKAIVTLQAAGDGQAADSFILGLKALDISGGMVAGTHISVSKMLSALPYITQAVIQTHGILTPAQILRMMQQAGPAATATSFIRTLEDTAEAISSLGPAVGRGLFTAFMTLNVGRASAVSAHYLTKSGLVPEADMHKIKGSSTYIFNPDDLYGAKYLHKYGFLDWIHYKIIPYLKKHGDKTPQELTRDLAGIVGTSTAARLVSWAVHNWPQVDRTIALINNGVKNGTGYNAYQTTWKGATDNFQKAWGGLMTALGLPGVNQAAVALNHLSSGIHKFTAWFSAHPKDTKLVEQGLLALGAGLLAIGAVLTGAAFVALLGTGGLIAAFVVAVATVGAVFAAFHWKEMKALFEGALAAAVRFWKHPIEVFKHLGVAWKVLVGILAFALGPISTLIAVSRVLIAIYPTVRQAVMQIPSLLGIAVNAVFGFFHEIAKISLGFLHDISYIATHPIADIKNLGKIFGNIFTGQYNSAPAAYKPQPYSVPGLSGVAVPGWSQTSPLPPAPAAAPTIVAVPPSKPSADPQPVYIVGTTPVHVTNSRDVHNGVARSFTQQLMGIQTGPTGFDYSFGVPTPAGAW